MVPESFLTDKKTKPGFLSDLRIRILLMNVVYLRGNPPSVAHAPYGSSHHTAMILSLSLFLSAMRSGDTFGLQLVETSLIKVLKMSMSKSNHDLTHEDTFTLIP